MQCGKLRERITIQHDAGTAPDSYGQRAEAWQTLRLVWAEVKAGAGSETPHNGGPKALTQYTITIRYGADITSANRIVFRGKLLAIYAAIDPDGRRRQLVLTCADHPDSIS